MKKRLESYSINLIYGTLVFFVLSLVSVILLGMGVVVMLGSLVGLGPEVRELVGKSGESVIDTVSPAVR